MNVWTDKDLAILELSAKNATTRAGACAAASRALGRPVTIDAAEKVLRRVGKPTLFALLRRMPHPEPLPDPEPARAPVMPSADPDIPIDVEEPAPELPDLVREREAREAKAREREARDRLVDEVRELRARQKFLDGISSHVAPPRIMRREKTSGIRELTAVALASDWHVEESVDPASIAYRNAYNLKIAEHRVDRFFQSIVWNIEHQRASARLLIRDLVLWLGGDLMSGHIHEELVEGNALSPVETIIWLAPRLRAGILMVLEELALESVAVPCSFGNHGRTTQKRRVATAAANSFEWLMYHQLARDLAHEKRVRFEVTPSAHQYVDVYDRTIHFHHGDQVNYWGGVGGLSIPLMKRLPAWERERPAYMHCIGHFHQLKDFGRAVVNGSLIGFNAYAQSIGAEYEDPQQAFFCIDSVRGRCMSTPLWVEDHGRDWSREAA